MTKASKNSPQSAKKKAIVCQTSIFKYKHRKFTVPKMLRKALLMMYTKTQKATDLVRKEEKELKTVMNIIYSLH